MFEISFPELVLVPERLPEALRTLGLWVGRMRRSFVAVKSEIEREIGMDEVRRQLHNETVLQDIKRLEREVRIDANAGRATAGAPTAAPPAAALTSDPPPADPSPATGADAHKPNGSAA
jgi:sec-independent protein translocase protein TatB